MPASKPAEKKQAESFSNFSTFTRGGSDDAFGRLCRKVPPDSMSSAPYSSFSSSSISLADTCTMTTRSSRFERVLVQIRMDSSSESREDSTEDPRRAKTANSDAVSSHRGLVWIQPTPPRVPTAISSVPKTTSFGGVVCCLVSFSAAAVFFSLLLLVLLLVFLTGSLSSPSFV